MKTPIYLFLQEQRTILKLSNTCISISTRIHRDNVSKQLNGKQTITDTSLYEYSKVLKFDFNEIKNKYSLFAVETCKDGTLAEILKITAGVIAGAGVSYAAYKVTENLIDKNCKKISS